MYCFFDSVGGFEAGPLSVLVWGSGTDIGGQAFIGADKGLFLFLAFDERGSSNNFALVDFSFANGCESIFSAVANLSTDFKLWLTKSTIVLELPFEAGSP